MAKNIVDLDVTDEVLPIKDVVVDEDNPASLALTAAADVIEDIDPNDRLPDRAIQNDNGSVTLPLLYPQKLTIKKDSKVREETYSELTFHRLNGADQRAIAATSEESTNVVAFSRSTKISQAIMNVLYDKLDAADITAAAQVLSSFLGSGRKTGK
ncbi:hypothetical protein ACFSE0_10545 [Ochrobactrum teleogrylli]|uniref:Phage tail assembly protein n=1 Tax=Ochrobactrum teleogrylli TaxID=2479765 RepID=A0ABY2Y7L9_9HYPH|nr:hypothetical protein [[Ochrobactrum] teleogrylli]TNV17735.1 hypothetical protein FIC94_06045 [[Ochrobactrum] teleogrylli]